MDKKHLADIVVRESKRAQGFLQNQQRTLDLLKTAARKGNDLRGPAGRVLGDLKVLIRLVRQWITGAYRGTPRKTIIAALAALIYFVNPLDIVPDVLPLVGFLDDAAIVSFVWRSIQDDIQGFLGWEREHSARAA